MFKLLLKRWKNLREIAYILQIPLRATIDLQKQNLTLSDVFGIWANMKVHLTAINNSGKFKTKLSNHFYDALENRKNHIFANPFMKAAIFLDPRYRQKIINDEMSVNEVKSTLSDLWQRINDNDPDLDAAHTACESPSTNILNDDLDFFYDEKAELEKYFSRCEPEIDSSSSQGTTHQFLGKNGFVLCYLKLK